MDDLIDILDLPGSLVQASWNGVPFYMPAVDETVGRRVQKFLFPGVDTPRYQDLAALDGPLNVTGLYVGDDYVSVARQLRAAFRTPGSATLVHPWWGALTVRLTQAAKISFSQRELRMVRFSVTCELDGSSVAADALPATSSLDALLGDIVDAISAVETLLGQLLGPLGSVLWLTGSVESFASSVQSYWQSATGSPVGVAPIAQSNATLAAAAAPAIAALGNVADTPAGDAYGTTVAALLAAVPAAIAGASDTPETPAVGPGDAAVPVTTVDGRITSATLLAAATALQPQLAATGLAGGLALAQSALDVIAAVQATTTIAWTSNVEAQTALGTLLTAIDTTAAAAAQAAVPTVSTVTASVAAGTLWQSMQALRGALIADMTATIGRLPQVQTVLAAAPLPAWVVANILAGDTPSLILPTYLDLIARNGVRNPAIMPAGALETLAPASLPTLAGPTNAVTIQ